MSTHRIRDEGNLDGSRRLRDVLRAELPESTQGFVALDVDLLVRWYGERYGTDATGRLALVEIKYGDAQLGNGSQRTLRLLDAMLRRGDTEGRYLGAFLVHDHGDRWRLQGCRDLLTDAEMADAFERQLAGWVPLFGAG